MGVLFVSLDYGKREWEDMRSPNSHAGEVWCSCGSAASHSQSGMREVWGLSKRAWRDIHVRLTGRCDMDGILWNIEIRRGGGGKGLIGEGEDYSACVGVFAVGRYLGPRHS